MLMADCCCVLILISTRLVAHLSGCYEPHKNSPFLKRSAKLVSLKANAQRVSDKETDSERMAAIARRVCWWEPADVTLGNTPLFLCRVMVLGTWEGVCVAIDCYGREAFGKALRSAPPGLFDYRSWHYWHHRLGLLPIPKLPERAIPA